ncbi:PaaI family thioesterase [Kallotenue papyrolyticum]|uniref:PaaI family thioesterase n=1 Tax=Kallotenue papyrolyticum TaxID=1325125 RepID=UPI0004785AB4|nr:PaaI family thioesterase [Kallotenue papyrolyticum]
MTPEQLELITLYESLPVALRQQALRVLQRLNHRDPRTGPLGWQLGIHYVERAAGQARCWLEVDESMHNPGRVAHGAIVFALADSAMGAAVHSLLDAGQRTVTAELKINYLAPVTHGRVSAVATVISRRRRLAVVSAEVRDAQDQLVGLALGTFAIISASAPAQSEG